LLRRLSPPAPPGRSGWMVRGLGFPSSSAKCRNNWLF
jgi:hypothetical protein